MQVTAALEVTVSGVLVVRATRVRLEEVGCIFVALLPASINHTLRQMEEMEERPLPRCPQV